MVKNKKESTNEKRHIDAVWIDDESGMHMHMVSVKRIEDYLWLNFANVLCRILEEDSELEPMLYCTQVDDCKKHELVILGKFEEAKDAFEYIIKMHQTAYDSFKKQEIEDQNFILEFESKLDRMKVQYAKMFNKKG